MSARRGLRLGVRADRFLDASAPASALERPCQPCVIEMVSTLLSVEQIDRPAHGEI
jgi:hypothetical protein